MARKIIRNGLNGASNVKIAKQEELKLKGSVEYCLNIQRAGARIFPFIILEDRDEGTYFSFEFKPPFGRGGIFLSQNGVIDLFSVEKILIGNPLNNKISEKIRNHVLVSFDFTSIKGYLAIILKSKHSGKNLSSVKVPLKDIITILEVKNAKA